MIFFASGKRLSFDVGRGGIQLCQFLFGILMLDAEVGQNILHDAAEDRGGNHAAVDAVSVRFVKEEQQAYLRVVRRGRSRRR